MSATGRGSADVSVVEQVVNAGVALQFLTGRLRGAGPLAVAALDRLRREPFCATVVLPASLAKSRWEDLSRGFGETLRPNLTEAQTASRAAWSGAMDLISETTACPGSSVFLIEDPIPVDLQTALPEYLAAVRVTDIGSTRYWWVSGEDANSQAVHDVFLRSRTWLQFGAVTTVPPWSSANTPEEAVQQSVAMAVLFVVDALDQESLLLLRPKRPDQSA